MCSLVRLRFIIPVLLYLLFEDKVIIMQKNRGEEENNLLEVGREMLAPVFV